MKNLFLNKKGNSVITMPLLIAFSTIALVTLFTFLVNMLKPYIMYEKLLSTSLRYMFIIEEYGYLNENDKDNLIKDLKNQGFNTNNIEISATQTKKEYGEAVELSITYWYDLTLSVFKEKSLNTKTKNELVPMRVIKYGISKI
ncbi:MAG: hypothetical protein E7311_03640 [Clostridiales bacterium]|nr:hypothetical protein [Clostridiales bacterium]